jgi:hypothetical protein
MRMTGAAVALNRHFAKSGGFCRLFFPACGQAD